jgi:hypothetical protein
MNGRDIGREEVRIDEMRKAVGMTMRKERKWGERGK